MVHVPHCDGDCPVAGCNIPDNVKCGNSNGYRQQAYANADLALQLQHENEILADLVDGLELERLALRDELLAAEQRILALEELLDGYQSWVLGQ